MFSSRCDTEGLLLAVTSWHMSNPPVYMRFEKSRGVDARKGVSVSTAWPAWTPNGVVMLSLVVGC